MGISPSDLANLSVEEKLDLISDLWDSIEAATDMRLCLISRIGNSAVVGRRD
jgi:hypothetical protein